MAITSILSTASSALTANVRRIDAVANNLANLTTEDFKPSDVRTVSQTAAPAASSPVVFNSGVLAVVVEEEGPVDAATQFSRLIQSQSAYNMALKTLNVGSELSGELLRLSA